MRFWCLVQVEVRVGMFNQDVWPGVGWSARSVFVLRVNFMRDFVVSFAKRSDVGGIMGFCERKSAGVVERA